MKEIGDANLKSTHPNVEINLSPQFTQVFLTTHNLSLSQMIIYLGLIWTTQLSIGMTSLVVFTMIAAMLICYHLSKCLVGHYYIKRPFLVFVLKVTTSFRNTQCMMNTQHTCDGLPSYDGRPS